MRDRMGDGGGGVEQRTKRRTTLLFWLIWWEWWKCWWLWALSMVMIPSTKRWVIWNIVGQGWREAACLFLCHWVQRPLLTDTYIVYGDAYLHLNLCIFIYEQKCKIWFFNCNHKQPVTILIKFRILFAVIVTAQRTFPFKFLFQWWRVPLSITMRDATWYLMFFLLNVLF